jgi:multidrug efflux pump subunit AcrB
MQLLKNHSTWLGLGRTTILLLAVTLSSSAYALQPLGAFVASAKEHNPDNRQAAAMAQQRAAQQEAVTAAILPSFAAQAVETRNQYESTFATRGHPSPMRSFLCRRIHGPSGLRVALCTGSPADHSTPDRRHEECTMNFRLSLCAIGTYVAILVLPVADTGKASAAVQYALRGIDLDELGRFSKNIMRKLQDVPGAVDVDSTFIQGTPQSVISVDRDRAAALGVDPIDVASTLQLMIGGLKVSTYADRGEHYDIQARALKEYRVDDRQMLITVPSHTVGAVPLESPASSRI